MRIAVCDDETAWIEQTKRHLEQVYVSLDLLVVYFLFSLSFYCVWFMMTEENKVKLPKSFCYLVMFLLTVLEVLSFLGLVKKKLTDYYKKGQEYQQEYMEMELAHFREYKQAQDETRRVRHDMKNNLACISMLLEEGKSQEAKSQRGFFLWIANMFADHPVSCKRIVALEEGRGSGKVY